MIITKLCILFQRRFNSLNSDLRLSKTPENYLLEGFLCSGLAFFHKKQTVRLVNTTEQCCLRKVFPFYIIKTGISATDCARLRGIYIEKVSMKHERMEG